MTEIEAHKVFAVLCSLFPSAKIEPWERRGEDGKMQPVPGGGTRGAYARMLADLEYAPACAAVERVAATHRLPTVMPAIAEIREAYADMTRGVERAGGEAWGDVVKLHSRFSIYRHPQQRDVADPVVWKCLQALGWANLCNSENQTSDRSQFIALYDKLAKSTRREEITRTLPAATRLREIAQGNASQFVAALGGAMSATGDQRPRLEVVPAERKAGGR